MKYIVCLLFLIQIKNCKSETLQSSDVASDKVVVADKTVPRNEMINAVDQKSVGEKIQDQEKIKQLNRSLKSSMDREIERPYMWDIFVESNSELIQYYQYKDFTIGGNRFGSYYIKIKYEDANYQAIMLINEDLNTEYNALLVYEELSAEEKYQRTSEIQGDKIQISFKGPSAVQNLVFQAKNGLFLDFFDDQEIDKKWGEKGKNDVSEYELKGKTKNHLKNGYWIEKKYSMEYGKNIIEDGNYTDGQKTGDWNYSVEGPVDMIKTFDKGKSVKTSYP